ncbi:MAG: helix-turn-helix transcriptional regulator [Alphaproteobacteria bacterium]|nr:helix-turn-helix transcriptional regulator [Alphaproteobacteria bacterium]
MKKKTPSVPSEPEFLTTHEVAALLRVKERKIYDLVAEGEIPFRKITGKLLFPRVDIEAWLGGRPVGSASTQAEEERPLALVGSHDPLLEWALRESGCGIPAFFDGSSDGLDRFARGEAMAAGMHILDPSAGDWNRSLVAKRFGEEPVVLMEWARRQRGFILPKNTGHKIAEAADIRGLSLVSRQAGAGAQILWEHLCTKAGLKAGEVTLVEPPARDETAVALAVAKGKADAGFGLECSARELGLDFVPLVEERYDLLIWRRAYFDPPLQALVAFCRRKSFAKKAADLGGYILAGA